RILTTNIFSFVRAIEDVCTNKLGAVRWTGHSTSGYIPAARRPKGFITSSSTGMVLVFMSSESEIRAIVPENFSPWNAGTVNATFAPFTVPATYCSGIGTVTLNRLTVSIRSIGTLPLGPTRAPGCTSLSVTTPSKGDLTVKYDSISAIALNADFAAATFRSTE